mgnify:CR=1 FL=1
MPGKVFHSLQCGKTENRGYLKNCPTALHQFPRQEFEAIVSDQAASHASFVSANICSVTISVAAGEIRTELFDEYNFDEKRGCNGILF